MRRIEWVGRGSGVLAAFVQVGVSFINQKILGEVGYEKPLFLSLLGTFLLGLLLIPYPFSKVMGYLKVSWPSTLFYLCANIPFVFAVSQTSVSSALSIGQVATLIAYVLGIALLDEEKSVKRLYCVFLSIGGVLMIALSDEENGGKWWGDLLSLISAIGAALYLIYVKYMEKLYDTPPMALLGCAGLTCLVASPLLLFVFNAFQLESFQLPKGIQYLWCIGFTVLSLLFNVCVNVSLEKTSPVFVRIALACSIPLSFLLDVLVQPHLSLLKILGSLLVLISLVLFTLPIKSIEQKFILLPQVPSPSI